MIIIDNFNKDFNKNVLYIINKINQEREEMRNKRINNKLINYEIINNEEQIKKIFIYK